ncbi:gamma-glutamylcyclotransferase family protein [Burkholderia sp. MR1-5-21]
MLNVFVYGTLRQGEANDLHEACVRHGIAPPRLIGTASISGRMHDFGRFPGVVLCSDGNAVIGEVYEIQDSLLAVLDEIEQAYPEDDTLFVGQPIDVEVDGQKVRCLFYPVSAASTAGVTEIHSGDWVSHRRSRTPQH